MQQTNILKDTINTNNQTMSRSLRKRTIYTVELHGKSLFIFPTNSKIRILLKHFLEHPYFENFIYHIIGLNSLLLALDQPVVNDPYQKMTLKTMQSIISGIFVTEATLKILALGFVFGKGTYLRDPWNILDFIIVSSSIFDWLIIFASKQISVTFIRGFRALRALRPLRMVSKNEGMKTVVNSLMRAIPSLLNVLLITLLFLLVFGILGVQLLKGS